MQEAQVADRSVTFHSQSEPAQPSSAFQPSEQQLQQRAQRFGSEVTEARQANGSALKASESAPKAPQAQFNAGINLLDEVQSPGL